MNKVTSIDELLRVSQGELVELPPFAQGTEFIARMKRPSMMKLVKNGSIPNNLLRAANSLFAGKTEEELDIDNEFMKDMFAVVELLAESSFVEPAYQDIKDAGIELTDEQYMFIFNYTQRGIKELEPFPEVSEDSTDN